MKKCALGVVIFIAVLIVGGFLYAWSRLYNISATKPHWGVTFWFMEAFRNRSIKAHSDEVRIPNLDDPKFKEAAISHFNEMCRVYHGAPGYDPDELAEGLYPAPPSMISGQWQEGRSEAETYWIVKNGIKMTGMPAFGPTHSDDELWGLVALTEEIPRMKPEQYRRMVREGGLN